MRIQWQAPGSLLPCPQRTRAHSADQVRTLARSIAAFGLDQPLVADDQGMIVKGHARREAALLLNLDAVPVLVRSDLTPMEIRALRIADNKCAEADWHWNTLKKELNELTRLGSHCLETGFCADELDSLDEDAPEIVFPEYDERILKAGPRCPFCGQSHVR